MSAIESALCYTTGVKSAAAHRLLSKTSWKARPVQLSQRLKSTWCPLSTSCHQVQLNTVTNPSPSRKLPGYLHLAMHRASWLFSNLIFFFFCGTRTFSTKQNLSLGSNTWNTRVESYYLKMMMSLYGLSVPVHCAERAPTPPPWDKESSGNAWNAWVPGHALGLQAQNLGWSSVSPPKL